MNNANVVLRRIVKNFDDHITVPLLTRFYDWNMAYSKKAAIKGDFTVDARGSTALLVRDMQNQALVQLGQYMGNPMVSMMVNWDEWFREMLKANHIDTSRILKTEEEIRAAIQQLQQNPPKPPQVQVAEINAQTKMAVVQAEQQHEVQLAAGQNGVPHPAAQAAEIASQAKIEEANVKANAALQVARAKVEGELAYAEKMREIEAQNAQARAQERQDQMQLAILEYATQQKISLEQVKADLAKTAMVEATKRQVAAVEAQIRTNEHRDGIAHEANQNALDRAHEATQNAQDRDHDVNMNLLNQLNQDSQQDEPVPTGD
jgi:hypothetical protein